MGSIPVRVTKNKKHCISSAFCFCVACFVNRTLQSAGKFLVSTLLVQIATPPQAGAIPVRVCFGMRSPQSADNLLLPKITAESDQTVTLGGVVVYH